MQRRRLLGLAAGIGGSLAGCTVGWQGERRDDPETSQIEDPATVRDVELPVPLSELRQPIGRDSIPAIVDPVFGSDWQGLETDDDTETTLPDDAAVIGVERDGLARAYPLRVLDWHEIVNDEFAGPLGVSYCPLCGSSVTFERYVDGRATTFGVSGKLWRDDLVMYDVATESLWSQILATAIRGPRTGERLSLVPSTLTTWGDWRAAHPETGVLLPPPRSGTIREVDRLYDYFGSKYNYGEERQLIGWDSRDGELRGRTLVVGVRSDDEATAYPFPVVESAGLVEDRVGSVPVVVAVAPDGTLVAYDRRIRGRTLSFSVVDEDRIRGGGSHWETVTGRAVDGPFEGGRLDRANTHPPMFLDAWLSFTPDGDVYGSDIR